MMDKITTFNVGGQSFSIGKHYIEKYKNTFLYAVINSKESITHMGGFFIDRNPDYFPYILDYYRKDRITYPNFVNKEEFEEELDFYLIKITGVNSGNLVKDDSIFDNLCQGLVYNKYCFLKSNDKIITDRYKSREYLTGRLMDNYIGRIIDKYYFVYPINVGEHQLFNNFLISKFANVKLNIETFKHIKDDQFSNGNLILTIPLEIYNNESNKNKDGSLSILCFNIEN